MKKAWNIITKIIVLFLAAVFIALTAIYFTIFSDTNSLMNDVRSMMSGNVPEKVTAGQPVDI